MNEDRLNDIEAVAAEAAKYDRGDRSMLAGEALSAFANRVTAKTIVDLVAEVRRLRDGVREWAMKNEIAEPPLDWAGLGALLAVNGHTDNTTDRT
jgi:hypothetical protein